MGRSGSSTRCVFAKQCWTAASFSLLCKLLKCFVREQLNFQGVKCVHRYLFGSLLNSSLLSSVPEVLRPNRSSPTSRQAGQPALRCTKAHCQALKNQLLSLASSALQRSHPSSVVSGQTVRLPNGPGSAAFCPWLTIKFLPWSLCLKYLLTLNSHCSNNLEILHEDEKPDG